jgi:hypothetical protein
VFSEDYGDDGPDEEVYEYENGDYSKSGVGEEAELRRESVGNISEVSRSREGWETHIGVRGEGVASRCRGRKTPEVKLFSRGGVEQC